MGKIDWAEICKIMGIVFDAGGGALEKVGDHLERRKYTTPQTGPATTMTLSQGEIDTIKGIRESQQGP